MLVTYNLNLIVINKTIRISQDLCQSIQIPSLSHRRTVLAGKSASSPTRFAIFNYSHIVGTVGVG